MLTSGTTLYFVTAIVVMAVITLVIRLMPTFLPKRTLNSPLLLAVNQGLPLAVMSLLILSSLAWTDNGHVALSPLLLSQILALVIVLLSYHFYRQLLVSMVIGIASLNGFLYLLGG